MNNAINVSVIISVTEKDLQISGKIEEIKQSLAYVSYRLNKPLQFEIILITNNSSYIPLDERSFYAKKGPIHIYDSNHMAGKAQLFRRGVSYAKYDIRVSLNASFFLPAESIGNMILKVIQGTDVVTANTITSAAKEKNDKTSEHFEEIADSSMITLQSEAQSNILVFSKEVWDLLKEIKLLKKTYVVEFLYKAREAGFSVTQYNSLQENKSKSSLFGRLKKQIGAVVLFSLIKLHKSDPIATAPSETNSMINAGVRYNKQKFITHSTLSYKDSAINSFTSQQILGFLLFMDVVLAGLQFNIILLAQIVFAALSIFYLLDVIFNFFLVYKTVRGSSELTFTENELESLNASILPMYTILCPLYKEAHMLGHFLDGIAKIEWPPEKLDVLLLLEEDDKESIETISQMQLPAYVRTLIVPTSLPKTKPKACNYGLAFAKGEYVVIYDAEDIPDPMQLKKAYLGFKKSDRHVVCLQAKLNYHNATQNLLTRFFTAEYSWLFDISLPGLQTLNTIIPLGGTSNHFRKADLISLKGWDPFNVTEDADLGLRIFRLGYRTAIIDSVTLEEANSNVFNWIRQRSRWVKGYMQTYLVHTRNMIPLLRERGPEALMLHFVIGGRILFIFVNPLLWIITISYFMFRSIVGPVIEEVYTPIILYTAVISLVLGNYLYILGYVLGCVKRNQWGLIKYVFLTPFYLLLISIAGCMAFYQLLFKPHYWEKTVHGLHLVKEKEKSKTFFRMPDFSSLKHVQNPSLGKQ